MGTSQKTLDQVKSILGKLDRHIDDARQRRLGDPLPRPVSPVVAPVASNGLGVPNLNTTIPGPGGVVSNGNASLAGNGTLPPLAPLPQAPSKSLYGRAQPLRPEARSA